MITTTVLADRHCDKHRIGAFVLCKGHLPVGHLGEQYDFDGTLKSASLQSQVNQTTK